MKLYEGRWIAESFGNDKAGIGTEASQYFSLGGIPHGWNCHPAAPLCDNASTPVTTTGTTLAPGANGSVWAPLGPGCTPLTAGQLPRPAKGGTATPLGGSCPSPPCAKTPPLYRNPAFFTAGGAASNASCSGETTAGGGFATAYIPPFDPLRGQAQNGNPVAGQGNATTTGTSGAPGTGFNLPVAYGYTRGPGMHFEGEGSFTGDPPYLYSYTYAQLKNDAGSFGAGQGFFSTAATPSTLQFKNKAGGTWVATATVNRGTNRFGGVMKLLGSYTTKVCYFYAGGCGLGYGTWAYEHIGAAGSKSGGVVTSSWTTNFSFTYYNTALGTTAKYDIVAQRFPWTTGTVTVNATARGAHKTFAQRKGFDNRSNGIGTVQLVSPILTQWLAHAANAPQFETGGVAVMQINFLPEPGGIASLVAGLSMLLVLHRYRR